MGAVILQRLPRWSCGFTAIALAIYVIATRSSNLPIVFASAFFILICITDTLYSKIHNLTNACLALLGFAYHGWISGADGLLTALLGLFTGLALLLIPYLMGGMGGGDVKALAALGSLLGPMLTLQVFLYVALVGGILSLLHLVCSPDFANQCRAAKNALQAFLYTRDVSVLKPTTTLASQRLPYAAAIALGYFAHLRWGDLI